jgi:hypothetical protein
VIVGQTISVNDCFPEHGPGGDAVLSFTVTSNVNDPFWVGVPLTVTPGGLPLTETETPWGAEPLVTVAVYGACPPVMLREALYACPAVPPGSGVGSIVMLGQGGAKKNEKKS